MPTAAARTLTLSPEDDFAWEGGQTERHEFHCGEVFPRPGGSAARAEIIVRLTIALGVALRGTEFVVRFGVMRVQVSEDECVYPDLSVTRGPGTFRSARRATLLDPALVVEVLSLTTRGYDQGETFQLYRGMPPVEGVSFVDSERRRVEGARRGAGGGGRCRARRRRARPCWTPSG